MTELVKIVLIVSFTILVLAGGLCASCVYEARLDAAAPVVESCIKHPATRPPFGHSDR